MPELKEALKDTRKRLKEVGDEVRGMVNSLRPEQPLTTKTRKLLTSPVRRRLRRRLDSYRTKKEE